MEFAHASLAIAALILGAVQMIRRKHGGAHRMIGQAYVAAMTATALSSFFLTSMTGSLSFLHLLSAWTLFTLWISIRARRRGNLAGHGYGMIMLYGGLLTAALLAGQRHGLDLPVWGLAAILTPMWTGLVVMAERLRRHRAGGQAANAATA